MIEAIFDILAAFAASSGGFGFAIFAGLILGFISYTLFPEVYITDEPARLAILFLAPFISSAVAALLSRWKAIKVPVEDRLYWMFIGYTFLFCILGTRYLMGTNVA